MVKVHFQDLGLSGLHPPAAEPDTASLPGPQPLPGSRPHGTGGSCGEGPVCGGSVWKTASQARAGCQPRPAMPAARGGHWPPRPVPQSAATASQLLKDGQAQNGTVRHVHEPSARLANHGGCGKAGRSHGVRQVPTCRQSERWGGPACPTLSPGGPRSPRGLQRARRPLAVLGRRVSAEADSASPTLRANARSEDPGT